MNNPNYWEEYWSTRQNGGHRSQEESFLQKEAKEKLFHMDATAGGRSLILAADLVTCLFIMRLIFKRLSV